ncbi:uncharacterized protein RB166_013001 [Leptodactylus fuscus]
MAVNTAQLGNLSITTQVVPAGQSNVPGLETLSSTQNWVQALSQKKKTPIKSLSAVIILIGALQLCVGVSMFVAEDEYPSLVSRSKAFFGSLVFIISGIVTVVFANEESVFKIKAGLISHVINAITAFIGIIIYTIQVYIESHSCWEEVGSEPKRSQCVQTNTDTNSNMTSNSYDYPSYYYRNYSNFIYTLRVSLHGLILFYIVVGLIISSFIILLKWKSLKAARYTLLGN